MSLSKVEFCSLYLDTLPAINEIANSSFKEFRTEFERHTHGQNPQQVSSYAQKKLAEVKVDESLIYLYRHTVEFTSGIGDGLFEDMVIVVDVAETALRLSSKKSLSAAIMPPMAKAMGKAVSEDMKRRSLIDLLEQNAPNVQDYRIAQLENASRFGRSDDNDQDDEAGGNSDFTLSQQALALYYLLKEGMNVSGVDQTKMIALAHLLSGKKIPIKSGKENIANSGIKSAFGKMRLKSDKSQLTDLRFVLRFFKPFEDSSSEGMKRITQALEQEIAKVEARLRREEHQRKA